MSWCKRTLRWESTGTVSTTRSRHRAPCLLWYSCPSWSPWEIAYRKSRSRQEPLSRGGIKEGRFRNFWYEGGCARRRRVDRRWHQNTGGLPLWHIPSNWVSEEVRWSYSISKTKSTYEDSDTVFSPSPWQLTDICTVESHWSIVPHVNIDNHVLLAPID